MAKRFDVRVGPFLISDRQAALLRKWSDEDGVSEAAALRELIDREELRRLGIVRILVEDPQEMERIQKRQAG